MLKRIDFLYLTNFMYESLIFWPIFRNFANIFLNETVK